MLRLMSLFNSILTTIPKQGSFVCTTLVTRLCSCFMVVSSTTFGTLWSFLCRHLVEVVLTIELIKAIVCRWDLISMASIYWDPRSTVITAIFHDVLITSPRTLGKVIRIIFPWILVIASTLWALTFLIGCWGELLLARVYTHQLLDQLLLGYLFAI